MLLKIFEEIFLFSVCSTTASNALLFPWQWQHLVSPSHRIWIGHIFRSNIISHLLTSNTRYRFLLFIFFCTGRYFPLSIFACSWSVVFYLVTAQHSAMYSVGKCVLYSCYKTCDAMPCFVIPCSDVRLRPTTRLNKSHPRYQICESVTRVCLGRTVDGQLYRQRTLSMIQHLILDSASNRRFSN